MFLSGIEGLRKSSPVLDKGDILSQIQYSHYYSAIDTIWHIEDFVIFAWEYLSILQHPHFIFDMLLMVNCNITTECLTECILFEKIFNTADDSSTSTCSWHVIILWGYWFLFPCLLYPSPSSQPRSWELRTQKLKSHMVRTRSLNVLPLKPGVGRYIAIHSTLTARDFFLSYFYPSGPFTCIFSKTSPLLAVANTGFCVGPQN